MREAQNDPATNHGQAEVFRFLAEPGTHGLSEPVIQIGTHGAAVFLAGRDVYKVKKAVSFPFMDFSTLEKRRTACHAELAVNRPHAPDLYLGVVAVTRSASGALELGGTGEPVEWAVHLRRFDERNTLDLKAGRDGLDARLIADMATAVGDWHRRAEIRDGAKATAAFRGVVEETLQELLNAPDIFPPKQADRLAEALRAACLSHEALLLKRGAAGQVRRCHGDLHLRNIALIDGAAVLFDAIEFDEALASTDILYDLAFLLMDIWQRGLRDAANLCLNRYLWQAPDLEMQLEGLALLPLFMSLRAAIRAKIAALPDEAGHRQSDCRRLGIPYFDTALALIGPAPVTLIGVGGLSGSGKTTLAAGIASSIGRAPGAVHLRSDIERKRHAGIPETARLPSAAYGRAASEACYERLRRQARIALDAGQSVIVDAVHDRPEERRALRAVAEAAGVRFVGLWLDAREDALIGRVEARRNDASDADAKVVARQLAYNLGEIDWHRVSADAAPELVSEDVLALVRRMPA